MGAGSEKLCAECPLWVWRAAPVSCLRTSGCPYIMADGCVKERLFFRAFPNGGDSRELPQMMGWDELGREFLYEGHLKSDGVWHPQLPKP